MHGDKGMLSGVLKQVGGGGGSAGSATVSPLGPSCRGAKRGSGRTNLTLAARDTRVPSLSVAGREACDRCSE